MRHVPEDELHAYLDQALSRSQCIEIETHLAACAACRRLRDTVAAMRDRTTAILARGSLRQRPRPVPYPSLVEAAHRRRAGWRRRAVWAASFAGALLAGWGARAALDPHGPVPTMVVAAAPASEPAPVESPLAEPAVEEPAPIILPPAAPVAWSDPSLRLVGERRPPRGPSPDPDAGDDFDAAWAAASLPQAAEATGHMVASLPDLPVVSLRMRALSEAERPLVEVTQRWPDGQVVMTIEGPVAEVAEAVAAHLRRGWSSSTPSRSLPDYVDAEGGVRRVSRVVAVVGRLPADSLTALAQGVVLR